MKTIKLNLVIVFSIFNFISLAQEQRFVEIIVSDTISLKAEQFIYQISIGDQVDFYGFSYPLDDSITVDLPTVSEVEDVLRSNKFSYKILTTKDYTLSKNKINRPAIQVTLYSRQEIERLYKLLETIQGISGKIVSVDYESPDLYNKEMYRRLFAKAKEEASILAGVTGDDVGTILSVAEKRDEWLDYFDLIKKFSEEIEYNLWGMKCLWTKQYKREFQFRFELK